MKKLLIALLLCLITFPAYAKLTIFGVELEDLHINTVKGHLYESARLRVEQGKEDHSDLFARATDWMMKLHKNEKTFDIGEMNQQEAKVISSSIYFISRVERGEFIPDIMPATIGIWIELGQLVVIDKSKDSWILKIKVKKRIRRK